MSIIPPDIPTDKLIENFKERYIKEVDSVYSGDQILLSETLNPILSEILAEISAGILHRIWEDVYGYLKEKIKDRFSKPASSYPSLKDWGEGKLRVYRENYLNSFVIEGHPNDKKAVLEIGEIRPLFHIQGGFILIVRNVTIKYVGGKSNLIKEHSGPAFIPINVRFKETKSREDILGEFHIYSSIWIGDHSLNPYGARNSSDSFKDMYR